MNALRIDRLVSADAGLAWLASASAQAAALIVAVLLLRATLGLRLSPAWRLTLWLVVGLRLCVPVAIESRWNLVDAGRWTIAQAFPPAVVPVPASPAPSSPAAAVVVPVAASPIAVPPVAPRASPTPLTWLAWAWVVGVAGCLLRDAGGSLRLRREVARMRRVDDPAMLATVGDCARRVGVRRRVRLVETDRLRSPAVCGIVRPRILLPIGVSDALSPAELRFALMHELAHVRRHDVLAGFVSRLVRAVHWFNPLVWIGVAAYRADRELACDAAVLRAVGADHARAYGECLLRVAEFVGVRPAHAGTLGLFGGRRLLRRRIDMIATASPVRPVLRLATRSIVGVAACAVIGCAAVAGQPRPDGASTRPSARAIAAAAAPFDRTVAALDLEGVTLEAAAAKIAAAAGVSIDVDWDRLLAVGVSAETPARVVRMKNVRLDKALEIVFGDLRTFDGQEVRLDWEADGDGVVLSTADAIRSRFGVQTRTFEMPAAPGADVAGDMVELAKSAVDRASWKPADGAAGEIEARDGKLVVRQTPRRMARVAALVRQVLDPTLPEATPTTSAAEPVDVAERTKVGEFRVDAVPFDDAIGQLARAVSLPINVNWTAIEGAGVARKSPITLSVTRGTSLAQALEVMLDAAGGGVTRLDYAVDRDVVTVSTRDEILSRVVTKTYDIRDLLVRLPGMDETAGSGTDGNGVEQQRREAAIEQLTMLIQNSIESDTWKMNGGLVGSIQELGGQLIVTHTPRVQRQVLTLLEDVRRSHATQVNVEVRMLIVDVDAVPAEFDRLAGKGDGGGGPASYFLDGPAAKRFIDAVRGQGAETVATPRLTLFDGQAAKAVTSTAQAYTADYRVTRNAAGEQTYEPVTANADSGVTLEVQATTSADRSRVTLRLKPTVKTATAFETVPFTGGDGKSGLSVQRPTIATQSFDTTFTVPDRGTMVLSAGGPAGKDGKQVLLILAKPTVLLPK